MNDEFNKRDEMEKETDQNYIENSGIKMVIIRLLSDEDFKDELIENPDVALADYELSEVQKILIKSLSPEDLEDLSPDNIEEYFSADAAVYTPDEGVDIDEMDIFDENELLDDDLEN